MAKIQTKFICQSCSYQASKWLGKCPECNEWNSFLDEIKFSQKDINTQRINKNQNHVPPKLIQEIKFKEEFRVKTNVKEFDRVLGGGVVPGSLILIGGEPGIGKSTLLAKIVGALSNTEGESVLYVSGEESIGQVADRLRRVGSISEKLFIYHENNWQKILEQINLIKPKYLVIDSIQTTSSSEIDSSPGSVTQVREVTSELMNNVKGSEITCFVIGHITKEGSIAGPKVLEHMVDAVIYFEGDQFGQYRILRAIKNRFGNVNEIGIFEMKENGLVEVVNPSSFFLTEELVYSPGRSISCIQEGTRYLFVEIQALVVENKTGNGRRVTVGLDNNRVAMLVAVIEKYFKIPMSFNDVYLNVTGGMKIQSREVDLSIVASLLSSFKNKAIDSKTVFVGEVGLSGEVRSVPFIETRIKELAQLSYDRVITSEKAAVELKNKFKIEIVGIKTAKEIENYI
jgi:DNA repair protein RadA/Sms